jgi:high affinity Mn2+ porin
MNRRRSRGYLLASVWFTLPQGAACAADMALKAPVLKAVHAWTGFYLGGHVGYGGGNFGPDTNPLPLQGVFFPHSITGLTGGYQAGYNFLLPRDLVFGVETDVSFVSSLIAQDSCRLPLTPHSTMLPPRGAASDMPSEGCCPM